MGMGLLLSVSLFVVMGVSSASGNTQDVPTLTDVQRLLLLNAWKDVEIARLKFQALLKDYQKPGFDFDPETMTYREQKPK
jgi:hypothetical protein